MSDQPISPLVAELVSHNVASLARTTNALIDSLTSNLADREAELAAIRHGVSALFDGPFQPSQAAVMAAVLTPNYDLIAYYREEPSS